MCGTWWTRITDATGTDSVACLSPIDSNAAISIAIGAVMRRVATPLNTDMEIVMHVVIVTGAGGGIGRAGALTLAGMGYAVALVGRTVEKLEKVAGEIAAVHAGAKTLVVGADVSRAEEVESMVHRVV